MSDLKKYGEIFSERKRLEGRKTGLISEIDRLRASLDPLEKEALTLEITGDQSAKFKKAELNNLKATIQEQRAEVEETEKKIKIIGELLPDLRHKASSELVLIHRKPFEKDLQDFVMKLREALKAEVKLRLHHEQIQGEFRKIDSPCLFESWKPMMERENEVRERDWEKFIIRMKEAGFDVNLAG
jgi:hypothetical protein